MMPLMGSQSPPIYVLVDTIAPDIIFDGTMSEGVFDITIGLPLPSLFGGTVLYVIKGMYIIQCFCMIL